jgi:single-strand DNA-binding protein
MNKVILIGNLTKDPELMKTNSGLSVLSCSIATNKSVKDGDSGNYKKVAQFHNIVLWRNQAEAFAKYTQKGSKVAIYGELQTSSYKANDGTTKYKTEVVVNEFEFLTPKAQSDNGAYAQPDTGADYSQPAPQEEEEIKIENIPF